jgi:protein ImuB
MPPLYLCIHLRDFAAQALTGRATADDKASHAAAEDASRPAAVAILSGGPPLERVFAMNAAARHLGLALGMSRVQAESFPIALLRRDRKQEDLAFAELIDCAQRFSPRVEILASPQEESCGATLLLDVSGSERLLGSPRQIATAVRRAICGLVCQTSGEVSVAVAHNACAALLKARGTLGAVAIASGREAEALAPLPLSVLQPGEEQAQTLASWGIHTLGELAALPTRPLAARLGQSGLRLQRQARGEDSHLLVPREDAADAPLCESMELEHPVELLEPLLFLLSHMLEQVTGRAAQRALAIASVEICLTLDGNAPDGNTLAVCHHEHRCRIRPALPERDRMTLLKLVQLELELHPPEAAVVALRIEAHPARPQPAQPGLFAAQAPEAGRMEILLARLCKLVGEGRVGAPELLDSHAPEAFRVARFEPGSGGQPTALHSRTLVGTGQPTALRSQTLAALRMVRPPHAVAIEMRGNAPAAMQYEGRRQIVQAGSGPWRSSGAWWTHPSWCREEWDVVVRDAVADADGPTAGPPVADAGRCLRLAHDPASGGWYVIGIYD